MEEQKKLIGENDKIKNNESIQIIKKPKKKNKKKEKRNFKDLKDLLENIKETKENKAIKLKKRKNIQKEIIKGEEKEGKTENDILINKSIDLEKEIEDMQNNNTTTKCSSTSSLSNYHDFYINDNRNDKIESHAKEIKTEIPKFKRMNYILKKIDINKDIDDGIFEEKKRDSKNSSPIFNYYEGSEKNLITMNKNIIDYKSSINFVEKNIVSSTDFNFNNDKFIKKNNLNIIANKQNYNINSNINYNDFVNFCFNKCNNYYIYYKFSIGTIMNNIYYPNCLNINLFYNNIFLNIDKNKNDTIKNKEKEKTQIENNNSKDDENEANIKENKDSNQHYNLNNYIFQNTFSFEEKNKNSNEKNDNHKILENLNYNNYNNYQNYNSIIFNFTDNNSIYKCYYKNINNNINFNTNNINNEQCKKNENNKNNKFGKNEIGKKNTFCRRPNDWVCSKCSNLNFAFRVYCNRCSAPKEILINNNNF